MKKKKLILILILFIILALVAITILLLRSTPKITQNENFTLEYEVYSEEPNWADAIVANDLLNGELEILDEYIDTSKVNMNTLGVFDVVYNVPNSRKLTGSQTLTIRIVDTTKPVIDGIQDVTLEVGGTEYNWLDSLTITDNYDQELTLTVDESKVNYNQVGTYPVTIKVSDDSNNETEVTFNALVVDSTAPTITGLRNLTIVVNTKTVNYLFGVAAVDLVDGEVDVTVDDSQVNLNKLGTYSVIYKAVDSEGNETEQSISVFVVDTTAPKISGHQNHIVEVFTASIDYLAGVTAVDNYDAEVTITVDNSQVNLNQVGTYPVKIKATDKSGNFSQVTITVTVEDTTVPTLDGCKDLYVEVLSTQINYLNGVTATDLYDGIVSITVDDSLVNLNQVGEYTVTYKAVDSKNNETSVTVKVIVQDTTAPIINGYKNHTVEVFTPSIDYSAGVSAHDLYDGNILVIINDSQVNLNQVGEYNVTYKAIDSFNNKSEVTIKVYVVDRVGPVITGCEDHIVEVFTTEVDYLAGVSATDLYDGPLTVTVFDSQVNLNQVGSYPLTYKATDSHGNETTVSVMVHVVDTTAPIINGYKDLEVEVFTKELPYLTGVTAFDLLDGTVSVTVDDSQVNLNQVGTYPVTYQAIDSEQNKAEVTIQVKVVDTTGPEINGYKNYKVEVYTPHIDYLAGITASDLYDQEVTLTIDDSLVHLNQVGTYSVIITAIDDFGNTSSVEITVTVEDMTVPQISGYTNHTVEVYTPSIDYLAGVTASDNYNLNIDLSYDDSQVNLNQVGTYPVTITAVDDFGNTSAVEITVTVEDTTAPQISGYTNHVVEVNTPCVDYLAGVTASDNYDLHVDLSYDDTLVNLNLVGTYIVTITAIDDFGNTSTVEITVTVEDTTAPDISGHTNHVVEVNSQSVDYLAGVTASDNYDLHVDLSYDDSLVNLNKVGTYPVTIIAIDDFGNTSTVEITVTVEDTTAPDISGHTNQVVEVNTPCVDYLAGVTASDNYDLHVDLSYDDTLVNLNQVGSYNVTITAVDDFGNESSVDITVTVEDTTAPVLSGYTNHVVEVNTPSVDYLAGVTASDNYDLHVDLSYDDTLVNLNKVGIYIVTITAADDFGNESSVDITVTVEDTTAPQISGYINYVVEVNTPNVDYLAGVTATDNYDLHVDLSYDDTLVNLNQVGTYLVTITAVDDFGNESSVDITVTVEDTTAPVLSGYTNHVVEVNTPYFDYLAGVTASDNYDLQVDLSYDDTLVNLNQVGTYPVTITAVDDFGNESLVDITVTVEDTTAPQISGYTNHVVEVNTPNVDYLAGVTAADNYDLHVDLSYDNSLVNLNKVGTYPVTIIAIDDFGNTSTVEITVTVEDTTAPVLSGYTNHVVEVNTPSVDYLAGVTATDNYDLHVDLSYDDILVNLNQVGSYIVIITAIDDFGNESTVEITVTVEDTTAPVLSGYTNHVVEVNTPSVDYLAGVTASDNYDLHVDLSYDDTLVNLNQVGTYFVTISAVDDFGNVSSVDVNVTVEDTTAPVIQPIVYTVEVNTSVDYVAGITVTDNYDLDVTVSYDDSLVNLNVVGTYYVTIYAVDDFGNESFMTMEVNVVDTTAPILVGYVNHTVEVYTPNVDYLAGVSASDNYDSQVTITYDDSLVDLNHVGTYPVIIRAMDDYNNVSEVMIAVNVVDTTAPVISGQFSLTVEVYSMNIDYFSNITVTDNYDSNVTRSVDDSLVNLEVVGTYTVNLYATDDDNNVAEATLTVHVVDTTPPYVSGYTEKTVEVGTARVNYLIGLDIYDNYDDIVNVYINDDAVNLNQVGTYSVMIRVIDDYANITRYWITLHVIDSSL